MDDNVVYKPPAAGNADPNTQQPQEPEGPRITVADLYAPSAPPPIGPQPPAESIGQRGVTEQPEQVVEQQVAQPIQESVTEQTTQQGSDAPPAIPPDIPPDNVGDTGIVPESAPPMSGPLKGKIIKIALVVIAVIVVLGLVIGGASRFLSGGKEYDNATITYWGLWEESKVIKPIIQEFEKKYPGIKVVYEKRDKKQYKDRLLGRATTDTSPDIFTYHNTWVPTLQEILLPLPSDVTTLDDFKKIYYPIVVEDLVFNGAIYGIPQGIDTLTLFVNREVFEAAQIQIPQTWDQFSVAAKTMTVKDKVTNQIITSGAALGSYQNINHAADILSVLSLQSGLKFSQVKETSDSMIAALRFYVPFSSDSERTWNATGKTDSRTAFAKGELGFYFGYSWDIFIIQQISKKNNIDLTFDLYTMPYIPKREKMTVASYWVNGVSKKSKHQKEALLFIKYLSEKDVVQKLYTESSKIRAFGTPYARMDLADSLKNNPLVYRFVEQAQFAKSSFFASDTHDETFTEDLNEYLSRGVEAMLAGSSAESAVDTIVRGMNEVFTKHGLQQQ